MDAAARLEEFFRRLAVASACDTADEAFAQIAQLLIEVEDELSGLPADPAAPRNDGRMYPPQEDNRLDMGGRQDIRAYRTRGHRIYLSESGAMLIVRRYGTWAFETPDRSGAGLRL